MGQLNSRPHHSHSHQALPTLPSILLRPPSRAAVHELFCFGGCIEEAAEKPSQLRAWASHSSLERIDGFDDYPPPPSGGRGFGGTASAGARRAKGDFRGLLLSNQTHRSSADSKARLFKNAPGVGGFLSFMGHCVMENRNCLVVASEVPQAERDSALRMARSLRGARQKTLGADKGYDTRDFVADLRINGIMPQVAQNIQARRRSAIDGRTARHQGYAQSINARKRIEQLFGWIKQAAGPSAGQSRTAASQSN